MDPAVSEILRYSIPVVIERPEIPGSRQTIYVEQGYDLQGLASCGWVFPRVNEREVAG